MLITTGLILGAIVGAGCDTIGQDFGDMFSSLKSTSPREAAVKAVDPYNADNRREGIVLLSNAPWGGVDVYLAMYRDEVDHEGDAIVKATAIRALARHGQPEDAIRILPGLAHESFQVRWETAKGLQRLHNSAVVGELLKVLRKEDEQVDVRVAAAVALGQYPEDRVVHGLIEALDARELALNLAANGSLQTLTGQAIEPDAQAWFAWYQGAAAAGTAFIGHAEYFYPTYSRADTFWERLAFWTSRNFEKPAPPAGLRPASERSTYGSDQPKAPNS